jgi:hypothetical protein
VDAGGRVAARGAGALLRRLQGMHSVCVLFQRLQTTCTACASCSSTCRPPESRVERGDGRCGDDEGGGRHADDDGGGRHADYEGGGARGGCGRLGAVRAAASLRR